MEHLNERQKNAVRHINGPMLVLAGPGSGKTTVICHRVKNLLDMQVTSQKKLLVITFSKMATVEMKDRFNALTNNEYSGVMFSTFHAYFYRLLRRFTDISDFEIIYDDQKKQMILNILNDLKIFIDDAEELDDIINEISIVKNELIDINDFDSKSLSKSEFVKVFESYAKEKYINRKIDFDDMLSNCYALLKKKTEVLDIISQNSEYILIDEFQDINKAQYECIKLIASRHNNLFAVGDDDQSIYRFRGSNPEFLLNFKNDFYNAKEIVLDRNYRSNNSIIKLSNVIIKENKKRFEKKIQGFRESNLNPKFITVGDAKQEASFIAKKVFDIHNENNIQYENIAVIFRTNLQARPVIEAFMDSNIPFVYCFHYVCQKLFLQ